MRSNEQQWHWEKLGDQPGGEVSMDFFNRPFQKNPTDGHWSGGCDEQLWVKAFLADTHFRPPGAKIGGTQRWNLVNTLLARNTLLDFWSLCPTHKKCPMVVGFLFFGHEKTQISLTHNVSIAGIQKNWGLGRWANLHDSCCFLDSQWDLVNQFQMIISHLENTLRPIPEPWVITIQRLSLTVPTLMLSKSQWPVSHHHTGVVPTTSAWPFAHGA